MVLKVIKLTKQDFPQFLSLLNQMAIWEEGKSLSRSVKKRLREDFTTKPKKYEVFIAKEEKEVVGFIIYEMMYSTFKAKPTLFIEDLFIKKEHRRKGIASMLFSKMRDVADKKGCGRVDWIVLRNNKKAHAFYKKHGGKLLPQWTYYRIDEKDF